MDRSALLKHLRATHFESGDRELAVYDAKRIAEFLRSSGANRVAGIGSAFDATRPFTHRSDIDLAVEGIAPANFYRVSARAAAMTTFNLDLTPLESATPAFARVVNDAGVEL